MSHACSIRTDDLLSQLRHLQETVEDPCFLNWVQKELNGYDPDDELPWYRVMQCRQRGLFMHTGSSHQETCHINEKCLGQRDMERVRFILIRGPIHEYFLTKNPTLERWPDTLLREYSHFLIPEHICLYAWKEPLESVKEHLMTGISNMLHQYVPSTSHHMETPHRSLRDLQHRQWYV